MSMFAKGFLVALACAAVWSAAPEASACTDKCVQVAPFCRRCLDVGYVTNITCQDSGNCGCFFTQNTCGTLTSNTFAEVESGQPVAAPDGDDAAMSCAADTPSLAADVPVAP